MLYYFVRRSDRKRYTARQRSQAMAWTLVLAAVIVIIALAAA